MFSRDTKPRIDTLIARTVRIRGDLEFEGGLHLDGTVEGDVRSGSQTDTSLSVSESGTIHGAVHVRNLTLAGTVHGDIHASGRVVLAPTARVEGDVRYGVIEMSLGAQIMGKVSRLPGTAAQESGAEPPAATVPAGLAAVGQATGRVNSNGVI